VDYHINNSGKKGNGPYTKGTGINDHRGGKKVYTFVGEKATQKEGREVWRPGRKFH